MTKTLLSNSFSQWEITTMCNNNCIGCDVPKTSSKEVIPLDVAIRGVDNLAKAGIRTLEFIGGEPYMYPHMLDLIKHIYSNRPEIQRFAILTNALDRLAIKKTKPFLSKDRGGIVLSINYTKEQCWQLLERDEDVGMAKKSLAAWEVLDELSDVCWVRINCVINRFNVKTVSQIGKQVIDKGALFSFCPSVYKRKNSPFKGKLTFRSQEVGFACTAEHRNIMEKAAKELSALKKQFPQQVVPGLDYINFLPETCKNPEDPYTLSCKGLGLPYLRISSRFGSSLIDGEIAPKLRVCTDIIGTGGLFPELTISDLKYPWIIAGLPDIYQGNPQVKECGKHDRCPWSVTYALRNQKI